MEGIQDRANFCPHCGNKVVSGFESNGPDEPILEIHPVYRPLAVFGLVVPVTLFFTLWGAGFFGGILTLMLVALKIAAPSWLPFIFAGLLFLFGIPLFTLYCARRNYARTVFRIFDQKLEYYDGWFTIQHKSINYKNVTEVYLRKGIFQRKYGLGTIILSIPAGQLRANGQGGIRIFDIENSDQVYERLKGLVEKAR